MNSVLTESSFAEMIAKNGGRVYRVGGCVRDQIMGIVPKDIDFCIVGMVKRNFKTLFPEAEEYGKSFPVFRLLIDGVRCELAFARTERKVSSGYKGFKIASNPKITLEEDLYRRDTTVNSIAMDCLTGEIIDPYHGREAINNKILKATSEHFSDDPMRALRLAGQAARLGFSVEKQTLTLARAVGGELVLEPAERMLIELTKVLTAAERPATFFRILQETELLQLTFKELGELSKEDFERAMILLDEVAQSTNKAKVRFALFGLFIEREKMLLWNQRMTLPGDWLDSALIARKSSTLLASPTPENIVVAMNGLGRGALTIEEFDSIAQVTGWNLPKLSTLSGKLKALLLESSPPKELKGKEIGQWLVNKQIELIPTLLTCK